MKFLFFHKRGGLPGLIALALTGDGAIGSGAFNLRLAR